MLVLNLERLVKLLLKHPVEVGDGLKALVEQSHRVLVAELVLGLAEQGLEVVRHRVEAPLEVVGPPLPGFRLLDVQTRVEVDLA